MRSFAAALVAAATATLVAAQLRIETPTNLAVCQPALLSWTGGESPYYVSVIPGGQPSAASLKDFPQTDSTQQTWNVDLPAGQEVSLRITDSTGAINYSEKVTIREGSNTNCLNGASASGASTASSASSAAGGAASSASSAGTGATGAVAGAASSASGAVAGAASSLSSGANSATGAAGSSATSATGARTSGGPSGTTANSSPSASNTSNAASLGAKIQTAGVVGAVAAIFGVALF